MATELGLDGAAFGACLDSRRHRPTVEADYHKGGEMGVNATPAFFINGRFLSGAQPFEAFKAIIDQEIGN
jgi:protein-disulfide isomerase